MSKLRSLSTLCGANISHTVTFVLTIAAIFAVNPTWAAWPEKPITIIVPFPAGGGTDVVIRSLQPLLSKELGQTIVVENRSGAGGTIGSAQVARSKADGYTVLLATTSTHAVSVSIYPNLAYDPRKDFKYAGLIGISPYVLAVNPELVSDLSGRTTVKSLLAAMKNTGKSYNLASVGVGTVSHLLGEQFSTDFGLHLTHVPYRGATPAYTDLISGQVDLLFDNPISMAAYSKAKKLIPVAATVPTSLLPDVATFAQQGIEGYTQTLWYGLAFPKNTPEGVVKRFNKALNAVLSTSAVKTELKLKGIEVEPGTPTEMTIVVDRDISYWGKIAKSLEISLD